MKNGCYTAGELARKAGISIRTIRFYDQKGILKPMTYGNNGYRFYNNEALGRLQKILMLKYLGYPLESIELLLGIEDSNSIQDSLKEQKKMLLEKRNHINRIIETIEEAQENIKGEVVNWGNIVDIMQAITMTTLINKRFELHERYGTNAYGWYPWTFDKLELYEGISVLDIGCGYGMLWRRNISRIPKGMQIFMVDTNTQNMTGFREFINDNRKLLKEGIEFHIISADAEKAEFFTGKYDRILANHMLFYINDRKKLLERIKISLKPGGIFICSTTGHRHFEEVCQLIRQFDSSIILTEPVKYQNFSTSNAMNQLEEVFDKVLLSVYEDEIVIDNSEAVCEFIYAVSEQAEEVLGAKRLKFEKFIDDILKKEKVMKFRKEAWLFQCK